MSATVSAARLKEAATWAGRSIAVRPAVPAMGAAVIEVSDGALTVSGWDYETLTKIAVDAEGELPKTYVSGRLLADVTSQMSGQARLAIEDFRLVIKTQSSTLRLPVMPDGEYPAAPAPGDPTGISSGFADAVRRVAPAATREGAPELAFINLAVRDGELVVSARNLAMMSQSRIPWDGEALEANPEAKRLLDVARHMDEKTSIGLDGMLWLSDDSRTAGLGVHDKAPANFAKADGNAMWDGNGHVDFDRAELLDALGVVKRVLPSIFGTAGIAVDEDGIAVRAMRTEIGDATAQLAANLDGEAREVFVQAEVLATALNGLDHHEVVRISFGPTVGKSFLVTGVVDDAPDFSTRHIIQPIRL